MKPLPGALKLKEKDFLHFIKEHWKTVFNFSYRITNSTETAEEIVLETFLRAFLGKATPSCPEKMRSWLLRIGSKVAFSKMGNTTITFDLLDDIIRSDPTQITDTSRLTDPERNHLLWELQQGCMTAVLNCLSPGERLAFTLETVMKCKPAVAAAILEITEAALKVRLSRATKKISNYLAPRCGHINPDNPCRCPSRLGVALQKGFVQSMPETRLKLRNPPPTRFDESSWHQDVISLYNNLPDPEPSRDLFETMKTELKTGRWKAVRKAKQKKQQKQR